MSTKKHWKIHNFYSSNRKRSLLKNGEEMTKNVPYILQFIYSARLWQAHNQMLLITLLNDFIKLNVNTHMKIKNFKIKELNISIATVLQLFTQTLKMIEWHYIILIGHKFLCCSKNYQQKFEEKPKGTIFNTYKFSTDDNNKFILLLQKGTYSYEY